MSNHFKIIVVLFCFFSIGALSALGVPQDEPAAAQREKLSEPAPAEGAEGAGRAAQSEAAGRTPRYRGPDDYLLAFEFDFSRAMIDCLRASAVGGLFTEEPELKELAALVEERYSEKLTLLDELNELARDLARDDDLEERLLAWVRGCLFVDGEIECVRVYLYNVEKEDDGEDDNTPAVLICGTISDEGLETVTKRIGEVRALLADRDDVEIEEITVALDRPKTVTLFDDGTEFWFFREEKEFYCGLNDVDLVNKLEKAPDEALDRAVSRVRGGGAALVTLLYPFDRGLEVILKDETEKEKTRVNRVLEILGLAGIESLVAALSVEGAHFRETYFVESSGEPEGLFAALRPIPVDGPGAPPLFPSIEPNLMTLRGCLDLGALLTMVQALIDHDKETEAEDKADGDGPKAMAEVVDDMMSGGKKKDEPNAAADEIKKMLLADGAKALDGGYVFSLASPKRGGMVPRFAFAFGVGDQEKFDALMGLAKTALEGIIFEESTYKDVPFTMVKIPNNPAPLVPCYAQVGRALYIAETPWTMKGIIASLSEPAEGESASSEDVAETEPLPPRLPVECGALTAELDFDVHEIFRLLYDQYMPMIQVGFQATMARVDSRRDPLLDLSELPLSEVFLRRLTAGRGGAGFVKDGFCMSALSPLGDPLVAAMTITSVPLGVVGMSQELDDELAHAEQTLCRLRVKQIAEALKIYRTSFGGGKRFPSNLGELVTRGLIDDLDLFLVPSDEEPATVEFMNEDGEIETMEISYKYLADSKFVVPAEDLERYTPYSFNEFDELYEQEEIELLELEAIIEAPFDRKALSGSGDDEEETKTVILYELNANSHKGRFLLCADGTIHHVAERKFKALIGMK